MCSILRGSCWPVEALTYLGQRLGGKILDGKHMAHAHRAWYENKAQVISVTSTEISTKNILPPVT